MKRIISVLMLCLVLFFMLPTSMYADIGPKPSVTVSFEGLGDEVYYVTLLSKTKATGPYSYSTEPLDENSFLVKEQKEDDLNAWQAFRDYIDTDQFFFINYFERYNEAQIFRWGYYPPNTFKVLVYIPKENTFLVSDIQEKYAFDSYYKAMLSEDSSTLNISKNYNYSAEIISLIARILCTIAIEVLIALFFGLKTKKLLLGILTVNAVTQIVLNVLLNIMNYKNGSMAFVFFYICLELVVVLMEAIIFSIYFEKVRGDKPIKAWIAPVYAITANAVSFIIGLSLAHLIPGIF